MERRHEGLRRTVWCLVLLAASLSIHLIWWLDSATVAMVVLAASPLVVLAVAVHLARSEPRVGRVICTVIAALAGLQLMLDVADRILLDDPSGLTAAVWTVLLGTGTAFLAVVLFVAQPAMTTHR